jgi:hypothetical protein
METIKIQLPTTTLSAKVVWTGRIITWICVVFLLVDSIMKIIIHPMYVDATNQLGWSTNSVQPIGIVLFGCTILYIVPRTAIFGVILLTAYLGGAVATIARLGQPFFFPVILSILLWLALYIRNEKLREVIRQVKN